MKTWFMNRLRTGVITAMSSSLLMLAVGCSEKGTDPAFLTATVDEDVAESVASSTGSDNGGLTDQMADAVALANGSTPAAPRYNGEQMLAASAPTYDASTGLWTQSFTRERGLQAGLYYAFISRTYTWRFLNANGLAQQFYITGADTATTIQFNIVDGDGQHKTPRVSQLLTSLAGSWVVTNANKDTVTLNGTYSRSALDTIKTRRAIRTYDHALSKTISNVLIDRSGAELLERRISGVVVGSYAADITFQSSSVYNERSVNRTYTVTYNGDGTATVVINGKNFTIIIDAGELVTDEVM